MIQTDKKISKSEAEKIYKSLLLPRLIEERMLKLLRQNKISKWFSGIGQEAISVGTALTIEPNDYILPMHRNLGIFTTRGVPLYKLFCQLFGKANGFTGGRDRSFHFGSTDHKIFGMISHLAATMPVADGIALAQKLKGSGQVAVSFCGDGATSEGDFHEALNLAGVWKLPVIFIIENNGYGLSTPVSEQYACENLIDRADGYGLKGIQIDGNDYFAVQNAVQEARKSALNGAPVLIEAVTFRMRGHEEASGTFYVPDEELEEWQEKDPILRFENWLKDQGYYDTKESFDEFKFEINKSFETDLKNALKADEPVFNESTEIKRAGLSHQPQSDISKNSKSSEKRFIDCIQLAQKQALSEDESFILMGQDVAEYGGVFKVSEGFVEEFGKERIRNTPIIESGVIGAAIGLSIEGFKPIVEIQFADFISCGFNQIVNNISKSRYRWTPDLNITIRAPHGGGVGAGPFHSQSPEGWFMQHPGLRVLVPSSVEDAQNMLYTALYDPNPVLFFEHKRLYRSIRSITSDKCNIIDIETANTVREGTDISIITYGLGVLWALEIADEYAEKSVNIEILDLRSLAPIDWKTVLQSVQKTGKVLLLQEPSEILGPMSEISSGIMEKGFEYLDAPVMRCSSLQTPIPFNKNMEEGYLAKARLKEKLDQLILY
ncbi:alpha-ketoacid dehydrogenase subunit alpha/beta [Rhodohalobacter sulfatireducens]|uniref:Thiamine pyrophosphate-dependent enzyme n=1 Tax=Rhodohalobacter sulfatireducens TaxID=2911366 RepID=A0ABS9KBC2_9BACT|nr:thiamine pyrophosphate-dependent enzyme [Rhodohalobacter sulfatireducens]